MGCPLSTPSATPCKEKGNDTTPESPKSLRNTSDSDNCNSSSSSDDGQPLHNTALKVDRQDELVIPTATPPAAADEPYHVFGARMKWLVVVQIGVAGTFSGLTSSIYFPCLKTITKVNEENFDPSIPKANNYQSMGIPH